jgi:DNA invertase Pin-like site-specific DNA recombinase
MDRGPILNTRRFGQLIGYARTSTAEQQAGLEAQTRDLKAAGCSKIFREQVSSVGEREHHNANTVEG